MAADITKELHAVLLSDLKPGEWVKVTCSACGHRMFYPPSVLLNDLGLRPYERVVDVATQFQCSHCDAAGKAHVSVRRMVSA